MAFAYVGSANAAGSGVTSLTVPVPAGAVAGNLLVTVLAFEGVAAGSGPWTTPNVGQFVNGLGPAKSWMLACWQAPSGTGVGVEVWVAVYSGGANTIANFAASRNVVAVMGAWSGEYNPTGLISGAPPRLDPTAQVTGNQPAAPSVSVNNGELVIACGADLMGGAGFGTPSGFTNRVDANRAGAGTAEATIADMTAGFTGSTGPIVFPNAAAAGTTLGTTATLVITPAPATTPASGGAGGPIVNASLPPDLDLPDGYRLTWAAIDPVSGADVSGVRVSNVSIFGTLLGAGTGGGGGGLVGPFMLVPGPGA